MAPVTTSPVAPSSTSSWTAKALEESAGAGEEAVVSRSTSCATGALTSSTVTEAISVLSTAYAARGLSEPAERARRAPETTVAVATIASTAVEFGGVLMV